MPKFDYRVAYSTSATTWTVTDSTSVFYQHPGDKPTTLHNKVAEVPGASAVPKITLYGYHRQNQPYRSNNLWYFAAPLTNVRTMLAYFFLRAHYERKISNWRAQCIGVGSRIPNRYINGNHAHMPMLDYDGKNIKRLVKKDVKEIQEKYSLGPAHLYRTKRGIHVYFPADIVSHETFGEILEHTQCCPGFRKAYGSQKSAILRVSAKYTKFDIRPLEILPGPKKEPSRPHLVGLTALHLIQLGIDCGTHLASLYPQWARFREDTREWRPIPIKPASAKAATDTLLGAKVPFEQDQKKYTPQEIEGTRAGIQMSLSMIANEEASYWYIPKKYRDVLGLHRLRDLDDIAPPSAGRVLGYLNREEGGWQVLRSLNLRNHRQTLEDAVTAAVASGNNYLTLPTAVFSTLMIRNSALLNEAVGALLPPGVVAQLGEAEGPTQSISFLGLEKKDPENPAPFEVIDSKLRALDAGALKGVWLSRQQRDQAGVRHLGELAWRFRQLGFGEAGLRITSDTIEGELWRLELSPRCRIFRLSLQEQVEAACAGLGPGESCTLTKPAVDMLQLGIDSSQALLAEVRPLLPPGVGVVFTKGDGVHFLRFTRYPAKAAQETPPQKDLKSALVEAVARLFSRESNSLDVSSTTLGVAGFANIDGFLEYLAGKIGLERAGAIIINTIFGNPDEYVLSLRQGTPVENLILEAGE